MWKEQLKAIKDELGFTKTKDPKQQTQNTKHHKTHKKRVNKNKRVNHSKKVMPDLSPLLLIGRATLELGKKIEPKKSNLEIEVDLSKIKKPDRSMVKTLLDSKQSDELYFYKQANYENTNAKTQQLVIGLDFGTAFTKVVVGETTYAHAISFGSNDCLLPSIVHVDLAGRCFITATDDSEVFSELKLPLLLESATRYDHIAVVSFLALVFRQCRLWSENSIYKIHNIDWLVNVGLPTESYHDDGLSGSYKIIIQAAWSLSFCKEISIQNANNLLTQFESENIVIPPKYLLAPDLLNLFPEFAAQIVGYVQSPSRREYSHLLIDVGAGTLDVAMFTVKNDDGDWLFQTSGKDITTLGSDILAKHRVECSKTESANGLPYFYTDENELAKKLGISAELLSEIDDPFERAVNSSLIKVVESVAGGYKITEEITTFICGGGSNIALYNTEINRVRGHSPLKILPLPLPERLRFEGDSCADYQRLSVAYGLSYDPFDIGKVIERQSDPKPKIKYEYKPSDYLLSPK